MKLLRPRIVDFNWKILVKNVVFSIVISFSILIIGLSISFIFTRMMPGDPILAFLPPGYPDPILYEYYRNLYIDRPFIYIKLVFSIIFLTG